MWNLDEYRWKDPYGRESMDRIMDMSVFSSLSIRTTFLKARFTFFLVSLRSRRVVIEFVWLRTKSFCHFRKRR